MTLQQLKYVITVAGKGSISEAAKSLFISQPSLTNAVKDLEEELNIRIFNRNNKGISISADGEEFLGYARQVIEQAELLEQKYLRGTPGKLHFSVSSQHYSFVVDAYVDLIKEFNADEYDFTLKETRTFEIIDDVRLLRSEIGVLYICNFNEKIIKKFIRENDLIFHELFSTTPHVFISKSHPLASKEILEIEDLTDYPYFSYEQGSYNSFYFSEEALSTMERKKNIRVCDRATLFNLLIGLNGYTICTGVINKELNGADIIALPLNAEEKITLGYLTRKNINLSHLGEIYLKYLKYHTKNL
ncbi:MAG: LysR family transcriptional regulator [Clostridiales bacterium]|nr:LysR family transcriptional regulator [Clostridiales bacterium]MCD8214288.1 LysR family transcriptional regulator [Clostridiales bacterium]